MGEKYTAYESGARGNRSWLVLEEDGSPSGRVVATDLTQEDCEQIVSLLNGLPCNCKGVS